MRREGVYSPQPRARTSSAAEALICSLFRGGYTKRGIRLELTARGVKTATGAPWRDGTIQRVLERNRLWQKERTDDERYTERFRVDPETGCHIWTGATSDGRGRFDVEGRNVLAYQYAYMREHGLRTLPADHDLHDACRNPLCVNPAHLVLIAQTEHKTLEREEEAINNAVRRGDLVRELEAFRDDASNLPPLRRVGSVRVKRPTRVAA